MNEILRRSPVDLRQLGSVGRAFPELLAQMLKLGNASIFNLERPVSSLEQAAVSLGAHVLRSLGLASALVDRVRKSLPVSLAQPFWQHSLSVALLSERIAAWRGYAPAEAYLAGLLHDTGRVPLLIALADQCRERRGGALCTRESIEGETQEFGIDHCELGLRIGSLWGFPEILAEVLHRHHGIHVETEERELVRIVGTAEALCATGGGSSPLAAKGRLEYFREVLNLGLPDLDRDERANLAEALELEFLFAAQGVPFELARSLLRPRRGRPN
jgi:putative nucleotidyltransferase with HDIG domain